MTVRFQVGRAEDTLEFDEWEELEGPLRRDHLEGDTQGVGNPFAVPELVQGVHRGDLVEVVRRRRARRHPLERARIPGILVRESLGLAERRDRRDRDHRRDQEIRHAPRVERWPSDIEGHLSRGGGDDGADGASAARYFFTVRQSTPHSRAISTYVAPAACRDR